MITCNIPTGNYSSGRALLLSADHESDGRIGAVDIVRASQLLAAGEMTREEYDYVVQASTEGEIDSYCPPVVGGGDDVVSVFVPYAVAFIVAYTLIRIVWK